MNIALSTVCHPLVNQPDPTGGGRNNIVTISDDPPLVDSDVVKSANVIGPKNGSRFGGMIAVAELSSNRLRENVR